MNWRKKRKTVERKKQNSFHCLQRPASRFIIFKFEVARFDNGRQVNRMLEKKLFLGPKNNRDPLLK